jgi:hypothetical protein
VFAIDIKPLGLPIRSVFTASVGAFVPIEAEPFQIGDELIFEAGFAAVKVGVFDAEDHGSTLLPGEKPIEKSCAGIANVQMAGGRWSETYADGIFRHEKMLTKLRW